MNYRSVAEAFWPEKTKFSIPVALYCVPFPDDWCSADTRYLLIEAVVNKGKGIFGGTPIRDTDLAVRIRKPVGYSHSLVYLIDRERGVVSASFGPYYVNGPFSFGGGGGQIAAIADLQALDVTGIEKLRGLMKLRHSGVYQKVPGLVFSQEKFRPKFFCVNRLTEEQYKSANRFIESFHGATYPYQVAGLGGFNCDRFRRAAREAAGRPVSMAGRIFPWPAFRAASIRIASMWQRMGFKPVDTRHYAGDVTVSMLRRAYRNGLIAKPRAWRLLEPSAEEIMNRRAAEGNGRKPDLTRRNFLCGILRPPGAASV